MGNCIGPSLYDAVRTGNLEVVQKRKLSDRDRYLATLWACIYGRLRILEHVFLTDDVDDLLGTSLQRGHVHIFKYLHEIKGADVRKKDYLAEACVRGHDDIVKYLMAQSVPVSTNAISWTFCNGRCGLLRYFHEQGVDLTSLRNFWEKKSNFGTMETFLEEIGILSPEEKLLQRVDALEARLNAAQN